MQLPIEDNSKLTEMECSKERMALVSTITQSPSVGSYQEISIDYFSTNDQIVNKKYKLKGGGRGCTRP